MFCLNLCQKFLTNSTLLISKCGSPDGSSASWYEVKLFVDHGLDVNFVDPSLSAKSSTRFTNTKQGSMGETVMRTKQKYNKLVKDDEMV